MKVSDLDPKEIEYICTLDWDPLMTYLEKKYGIEFISVSFGIKGAEPVIKYLSQ